jgi:hypothetical protein
MSQVWVYQFTIYDGWNDEMRLSSRWATHAAIENIKVGIILEHTGTLIDEAHLDPNGMTERGFMPGDEKSMGSGDINLIPVSGTRPTSIGSRRSEPCRRAGFMAAR